LQSIREKKEEVTKLRQGCQSPALSSFIYALKSSEAQRQYPGRLKLFFDYLGLPGPSLEEQAETFLENSKGNVQCTQDSIISFVNYPKQRVMLKEFAAGILNNYYSAARLFCEINDITAIKWRGCPED
jgi:hypothetical protein